MSTHREGWRDCVDEVKKIMLHELNLRPNMEMTEMFRALERRQLKAEIKATR